MHYDKLTLDAHFIINVFSARPLSNKKAAELLIALEQHFNNMLVLSINNSQLALRVHFNGNTLKQEKL